jgi:hypothetical protein
MMNDTDRKLLKKVFRYNGAKWTYTALAVWFVDAAWNRAQLPKIKPWTRQRVEAFKFLNALTKDYTPRAVYEAAKEVDGGHQDRVERASRRQLMKVIMQAVA